MASEHFARRRRDRVRFPPLVVERLEARAERLAREPVRGPADLYVHEFGGEQFRTQCGCASIVGVAGAACAPPPPIFVHSGALRAIDVGELVVIAEFVETDAVVLIATERGRLVERDLQRRRRVRVAPPLGALNVRARAARRHLPHVLHFERDELFNSGARRVALFAAEGVDAFNEGGTRDLSDLQVRIKAVIRL